jgi:AbrB family looped-hinge helix DNA binding protein
MVSVGRVQQRGQITLPRAIREALGVQPGNLVMFRATAPHTVEMRVLPTLTLAEMFERYRIEGPIDEASDREQWQAEAAKDVFGERSR